MSGVGPVQTSGVAYPQLPDTDMSKFRENLAAMSCPQTFQGVNQPPADVLERAQAQQPPEKEEGGKWGLLKLALVITAGVAAFKTGKGLELKGKGFVGGLKEIFSGKTVGNFMENLKFWKWFGSKAPEKLPTKTNNVLATDEQVVEYITDPKNKIQQKRFKLAQTILNKPSAQRTQREQDFIENLLPKQKVNDDFGNVVKVPKVNKEVVDDFGNVVNVKA